MASAKSGPGLYEFLIEAELQQYYSALKTQLHIQNTNQIKYASEEDFAGVGMSKPEIRRLKKFFQKYYPQTYLSKFRKKLLSKRDDNGTLIATVPPSRQERPPVKVPSKHIIPAEAIVVNKELGTGEFGVVQQGIWTNEDGDRIQVAIKCLSKERMQANPLDFLKEAAIMHGIDHEHIVRLYGVVLDTDALMLVTELAPLRSLLECLKEPALRPSFTVITLCDFAIQICDGMSYLESKRLIHRDLAARNILVFSKNKVKISDFGLSRALGVGKDYYQTNFNVNLKLPIAWCAPESINYLRFTSASDVWAYGVTLWEMFSYGFQPWAALTGQQILEAIDSPNLQRLEQPEHCPREYYTVMLKCWQHDANKRPSFENLLTLLPECKPEQVEAIQDCPDLGLRDALPHRARDVITVLDKKPTDTLGVWKGVLPNGKTGLFNAAHTVTYLGTKVPSSTNLRHSFSRGDGKNGYSSKRKLRPEMISCPQGDLRHTGHVGADGAFFGDVPHQVLPAGRQLPVSVADGHANRDRDRDRDRSHLSVSGLGSAEGASMSSVNGLNEDSLSALGAVGGGYGYPSSTSLLTAGDPPSTPASPLDGGPSGAASGRLLARAPSDLSSDRAPLLTPRTPVDAKSGPTNGLDHLWSSTLPAARPTDLTIRDKKSDRRGNSGLGGRGDSKTLGGRGGSGPSSLPVAAGGNQHEYHEISDEENGACGSFYPGVSGNALESPAFESSFDLGVSLMDEVMKALTTSSGQSAFGGGRGHGGGGDGGANDGSSFSRRDMPPPETPNEAHNARNEMREMENRVMGGVPGAGGGGGSGAGERKKQQATVKPISSSDHKKLESAITMTKELASRSMQELAMKDSDLSPSPSPTAGDGGGGGRTTPNKKKFSFKFPASGTGVFPFSSKDKGNSSPPHQSGGNHNGTLNNRHHNHHGHHYQNDRGSVDDLQETFSEGAKEAYNALVDQRAGSVFKSSAGGNGVTVVATAVPAMAGPTTTTTSSSSSGSTVGVVHPRRHTERNNRYAYQQNGGFARNNGSAAGGGGGGDSDDGDGGCGGGGGGGDDDNPLRRLRTGGAFVVPKIRGNKHAGSGTTGSFNAPGIRTLDRTGSTGSSSSNKPRPAPLRIPNSNFDAKPERLGSSGGDVPPPVPSRDAKPLSLLEDKPRHQRKYPLIMPDSCQETVATGLSGLGSVQVAPVKPTRTFNTHDESFESQIAAELDSLDGLPSCIGTSNGGGVGDDHHSVNGVLPACAREMSPFEESAAARNLTAPLARSEEEFLDFGRDSLSDVLQTSTSTTGSTSSSASASSSSSSSQTRGKTCGIQSDEVRIMLKVLNPQASGEECLDWLNETDWDVHQAIKLGRLALSLRRESEYLRVHGRGNYRLAHQALSVCDWDVYRAVTYLRATLGPDADVATV